LDRDFPSASLGGLQDLKDPFLDGIVNKEM